MRNASGRDIPEELLSRLGAEPFAGAYARNGRITGKGVNSCIVMPGEDKLARSLEDAIHKIGLRDGMTISFHHHLRNGDYVLNLVLDELARMGFRDITLAASALFECHAPLIGHIRNGVVRRIQSNYMVGPIAQAISQGLLDEPVVMRSHGGRDRAVQSGTLGIDVAFIAAPCADEYGNINGTEGASACGSLGYAFSDANYADKVIAITDNLVPYPAPRISIDQGKVDYVVVVDRIGDAKGIISGTTRMTRDPVGLQIAERAARVIDAAGYIQDGFSFQTGAGGASLAAASYVRDIMRQKGVRGSFGLGGITELLVGMLEEGLFRTLLDTQCFDLKSVESLREDRRHIEISSSMYANPFSKGSVVNKLDAVILGATEIDTDFNVNVTTGSDGSIMGGSGGHCDTAAGSKLSIIVTNLMRSRMPVVVDRVTTINTPGETVDVLVTEYGIAVNPSRPELEKNLVDAGLPVKGIDELKQIAYGLCGRPADLDDSGRVIAAVEYRDGTILDTIRQIS